MTKPTCERAEVLAGACERVNGVTVPPPTLKGGHRKIVVTGRLARGYAREVPQDGEVAAGVGSQARLWLDQLTRDHTATTEAIAKREGFSERAVRMKLSLAFLAPDIVEAAIAGRLPQSFGATRLSDLPMDWTAQRRALGIAQHAR